MFYLTNKVFLLIPHPLLIFIHFFIQVGRKTSDCVEYLELNERQTKTRTGISHIIPVFLPWMYLVITSFLQLFYILCYPFTHLCPEIALEANVSCYIVIRH